MCYEEILLAVSVLPVFFLAMYIYSKDKNKEPFKLLSKLFIAGIGSCFLVSVVSSLLGMFFPILAADPENLTSIDLVINVFLGIALVEESCKWIMTYRISYNHREFDELYDMIIYSAFVSLGFACFENILYVFEYGMATGLLRAITAIPGHACFGVLMGTYLGLAKLNQINNRPIHRNKNLFLSIFIPMIAHGIYDYCIFVSNFIFDIIFLVFIFLMYMNVLIKVKKIASLTRKIY